MTPKEIYRRMISEIREADVRLVAACMEDAIGMENAVAIQSLTDRTGMHERVVRAILSRLVTEFGLPIGAQSGKAGRWIIADEFERDLVIADLQSRVSETQTRIRALRSAKLVGKLPEHWEEPECEQQLLFDLPEPKQTYQWEW